MYYIQRIQQEMQLHVNVYIVCKFEMYVGDSPHSAQFDVPGGLHEISFIFGNEFLL